MITPKLSPTWLVIAAILTLTLLINLPILNQPFGRDQGIFAYIGEGILNGYVPYQDSWDHKTPGIAFLYALAFGLFGHRMPSVHILETISILATVIIVYVLGKRLVNSKTGVAAALIYGVASTLMFEWWDRGQAESFMSLPLALSFLLIVKVVQPDRSLREPGDVANAQEATLSTRTLLSFGSIRQVLVTMLAGFVAGFAVYLKPTGGTGLLFIALVPACLLAVHLRAAGSSRDIKYQSWLTRLAILWLLLSIGFFLSLLPGAVYFGANGAISDLYQTVIVFNADHVKTGANLTIDGIIMNTLDFGTRMGIITPLALAGLVLLVVQRRLLPAILLALWTLAIVAGIWIQGKFFSYHWSPMIPPLAILAGCAIVTLWNEFRESTKEAGHTRNVVFPALAVSVFFLVYAAALATDVQTKMGRDLGYSLGRVSEGAYLQNFSHNINGTDVYSFPAAKETAEFINRMTTKEDTVLVWGFQALVNYLAERRSPSRFVFSYPLTIEQSDSTFKDQARETFLREFDTKKPKYVVIVTNDVNPIQTLDSQSLLNTFPEFKERLNRLYRLEKDIADFHIYSEKAS